MVSYDKLSRITDPVVEFRIAYVIRHKRVKFFWREIKIINYRLRIEKFNNPKSHNGMDAKNLIITPVKIEERKNLKIRAGDTVKVWQKIKEKDKFRLQVFEGLVLAVKHGKEAGGSFTVRKVSSGVGVERNFPIYSPAVEKIDIVKRSKVRQSKLYHVRDKAAKEIKRQMRNIRKLPDVITVDESLEENTEKNNASVNAT